MRMVSYHMHAVYHGHGPMGVGIRIGRSAQLFNQRGSPKCYIAVETLLSSYNTLWLAIGVVSRSVDMDSSGCMPQACL